MLIREFERNPNWTKETLYEVARKTGLSEPQVYKWGWDQKRKLYGPEAAAMMMASCGGGYSKIGSSSGKSSLYKYYKEP